MKRHNKGESNQQLLRMVLLTFRYNERELAEKCEKWCKKYKSCNLEIAKLALPNNEYRKNK